MSTRLVHPRVVWAILAMEAGLALPIISLPAQGNARPGVLGPILLLLLLPGGYLAVRLYPELRDPSWRLPIGIGLALFTRALVTQLPEPDAQPVAAWIAAAILPAALGVALWWRGSATTVAEMTAAEVRTEFAILAVCALAVLALMRPFVLQDPLLLLASVVLFAVGGLFANALARQDAADATSLAGSRPLALGTAVLPCLAAAVLVGILRPALLGTFWQLLTRVIELILTPIGLLLAWLASLLPRPGPAPVGTLPPPPTLQPLPNPGDLSDMADQERWLATIILLGLLLLAAVFALVIVKVMLEHWLEAPPRAEQPEQPELTVEHTGNARRDARELFGWLWRWLSARMRPARRGAPSSRTRPARDTVNAWQLYRQLLDYASAHGYPRRSSETVHQFESRLAAAMPEASEAVDVLTDTYEGERYGDLKPSDASLRRAAAAMQVLTERPDRPARLS